jgi:hypothetical protein
MDARPESAGASQSVKRGADQANAAAAAACNSKLAVSACRHAARMSVCEPLARGKTGASVMIRW